MRSFYVLPFLVLMHAPARGQQCSVSTPIESRSDTIGPPLEHNDKDRTDAVAHLGVAGANIEKLPDLHGFEAGIAHTRNELLVFFAPESHAIVLSGTLIPVPYDTLRSLAGSRAHDLAPVDGIRGMFVRADNRFQVVYATPDGKAAVAARMWGATGQDITKDQIRDIPGAVPEISISGPSSDTNERSGLLGLSGGLIGTTSAPEVIMFIDPQCIYSTKAMHILQPAIDAGKVRLKIVPLSLLDYEDNGASTVNARAMLSLPANEMAQAWVNGRLNPGLAAPEPDSGEKLARNTRIARQIGITGTPTFVWMHRNGKIGRLDGVPTDVATFLTSVSQ
ncbi:thiol:disulfide interchange protein [Gluconacetobacter entanii]|uniref:thiol:disulfide interchange protein n=1 Tax=Acetobacteraceae TaxID=433 RepID=UPI001C9350C2|nr:thiol:disulfide interchange protein [Gluconacetobacter entanii]MBY4639731.1 thiol:disulfide interchange protein [Gluconacetobacter entanii]MCW4580366.1 thiol:disulfide interchange protein [Gluconacetobacter entanii]MCW4583695.1 thiol:disulfide interchange protein [Gluconacetobacter entanii]MCW4587025.1 thiol:disulfide interchange protein [Gluconacetobacter entanii]